MTRPPVARPQGSVGATFRSPAGRPPAGRSPARRVGATPCGRPPALPLAEIPGGLAVRPEADVHSLPPADELLGVRARLFLAAYVAGEHLGHAGGVVLRPLDGGRAPVVNAVGREHRRIDEQRALG